VKIYFKTWRMLILPVAMLLMGVYGIRVCMEIKSLWIGMILIFFSIMGLYFGIYPFVYLMPAIIIDERGIEDKRMKIGVIPWSDISGARVHAFVSGADLCVLLKNPDVYINKSVTLAVNIQQVRKAINEPGIYITFGSFACDSNEVLQYIITNIERFRNEMA